MKKRMSVNVICVHWMFKFVTCRRSGVALTECYIVLDIKIFGRILKRCNDKYYVFSEVQKVHYR